ncbi:MAG: diaminopimelate decarboxylase [Deltaproteobacteria bacterium]|nr:diaminopimelate decarboxylase [Deltaproteobacteria bacterium]MBW2395273.1 diaminopimelate decarboxylase [Deltaproteobacteria bacterium]
MSDRLRREIAGVPVADLARDFGTPTYVYDAAVITERIADLAPFDVIRYAQKANSNLAVLDLCRRHGVLVDAVSAGEIHRALAAGYEPGGDPPAIVYTSDIFDREALDLVVQHGIPVNCGSPDMLDQYGERVPGGEVTLRINPGFGHGHSQKTNTGGEQSKHGIWHESLDAALERAAAHRLKVTGLHMHIGSGADLEHLALVAGAMEKFARHVGAGVRMISAGGGLPVPYRPDDPRMDVPAYFSLWDRTRKHLEAEFGHPVGIEIEPGRFLAAEAGFLVTEIRAIKQSGSNLFYLVDAGFNTLARPVMYGAYHPMSIVPADDTARAMQEVVVGGPLCESGDIFTQEEGGIVRHELLPEARVGEYLVVEVAGAYGFVMASNYNSKPKPAEVLIVNGKAHLARARQSVADLLRGECLPLGDDA